MVDYRQRSRSPEYMDVASVEGPDLMQALAELQYVNRFLGGTRASIRALERGGQAGSEKKLEILDLGTGAADIPEAMVAWARSRGLDVRVVCVDFNPSISAWAARRIAHVPEIEVQQADVFALPYASGTFDYVHCAMFLHHFPQEQAVRILQIMHRLCRRGIIVNDLHRHPAAYHAIKWCTQLLSGSTMVQHDAPVSVLRGFRRRELEELGQLSGVDRLEVERCWAFRFVATALKA